MSHENEYDVGYGKPPKDNQFKKGQSCNPKGRPKGVRNFVTELKEVLNSKVSITRDGKKQSISVKRATILKLAEKGLSGNVPAIKFLLELIQSYEESEINGVVESMSSDDADILERFTQKIRHQVQQSQEVSSNNDGGEHE